MLIIIVKLFNLFPSIVVYTTLHCTREQTNDLTIYPPGDSHSNFSIPVSFESKHSAVKDPFGSLFIPYLAHCSQVTPDHTDISMQNLSIFRGEVTCEP